MDDTMTWSRRGMLGAGAGIAATGALGLFSPAASAAEKSLAATAEGGSRFSIPKNRIGLQVFTVRQLVATSLALEGTLDVVGDTGVREIELAGSFYDRDTTTLRNVVEARGMRIVSNHFGPRSLTEVNPWQTPEGRAQIFADGHAFGLPYVGTASMLGITTEHTPASYRKVARLFNQWGREAKRNGFGGFFFHNHDTEFALAKGKPAFDVLLEETDPDLVKFEIDLGWLAISGEDPYEYLVKYQDRFPQFHVKDVKWDPNGNRTAAAGTVNAGRKFRFADLGTGDIDYAYLFSALKDLRNHRFFLEHDDAGVPELNPAGAANTVWRGSKYLAEVRATTKRR